MAPTSTAFSARPDTAPPRLSHREGRVRPAGRARPSRRPATGSALWMAGLAARGCARLGRVTGRPLLKALWPVLRRGAGSVQFGTDPSHARVLEGLRRRRGRRAPAPRRHARAAGRAADARPAATCSTCSLAHRLVADVGGPRTAAAARAGPARPRLAGVAAHRPHPEPGVCRAGRPPRRAPPRRRAGRAARAPSPPSCAAPGWAPCGRAPRRPTTGSRPAPDVARLDRQAARHARCPRSSSWSAAAPSTPAAATPWRARGIPVLPVVLHGLEAVVGPGRRARRTVPAVPRPGPGRPRPGLARPAGAARARHGRRRARGQRRDHPGRADRLDGRDGGPGGARRARRCRPGVRSRSSLPWPRGPAASVGGPSAVRLRGPIRRVLATR